MRINSTTNSPLCKLRDPKAKPLGENKYSRFDRIGRE